MVLGQSIDEMPVDCIKWSQEPPFKVWVIISGSWSRPFPATWGASRLYNRSRGCWEIGLNNTLDDFTVSLHSTNDMQGAVRELENGWISCRPGEFKLRCKWLRIYCSCLCPQYSIIQPNTMSCYSEEVVSHTTLTILYTQADSSTVEFPERRRWS